MKIVTLSILTLLATITFAQEPFNCVQNAYLFQYNDVYSVNLASGHSTLVAKDMTQGNINAVAYNPVDGYIWGYISSPASSVIKVGKNFDYEIIEIKDLKSSYVGAISKEGLYYSKAGGTAYQIIDLNEQSDTFLTVLENRDLPSSLSIADWAFNSNDGYLYTVDKGANNLYRIDPRTSEVINLGEVPVMAGLNYTYGAVYFDVDGHFYVSANQTGTIYQIKAVQDLNPGDNISAGIFSYGPASAANDGARCPTASVPQEICGNGLDDDDDGLIDCDDPSCSEYVDCKEDDVSSGNNGGLESNRRLSQLVAERQFNRAMSEDHQLTFGAPLPTHSAKNQKLQRSLIGLKDLIPIGILEETHALESTPYDLVDITNASEVYSVDYFDNDKTIATVLALNTPDGVYEHSKFICDRLAGAELNSVSIVYINDQPFIRSIIINPDGQREFVLSFSARQENGHMVIESHWNLDQYTVESQYYNFQIWTSDINSLMTLSEGILELIETIAPINEYALSEPPYVFVKRAGYDKGGLMLELMNLDFSETIEINGGIRSTETATIEEYSEQIHIEPYSNKIQLETGSFFDLGIRINSINGGTPDDLFISDGPWGVDDSSIGTEVLDYEIEVSDTEPQDDEYLIERNVRLTATAKDYVSAYRALRPHFNGEDLSAFNTMEFQAKGNGELEITLLKESVTEWRDQLHAKVTLTDESDVYSLPKNIFKTLSGEESDWSDIKMVLFTMRTRNGVATTLEMEVGEIKFIEQQVSTSTEETMAEEGFRVFPIPAQDVLNVAHTDEQLIQTELFDLAGRLLIQGDVDGKIDLSSFSSGQYILVAKFESGNQIVEKINISK